MDRTRKLNLALVALTVFTLPCAALHASVVNQTYSGSFPATISGTLPNQGTALEEMFTLTSTSDLTISTNSYASGGFQPNLTLFDGSGNYVASQLPSSPVATVDTTTGLALDGYLTADNLMPGTYTVALTDFLLNQSITATNLSDGFTANYGDGINFIDEAGNTRNGNYSMTIDVASMAQAPEPAMSWMMGPILIAFAFMLKRKIHA